MDFEDGAQLDAGQVRDVRGSGGGGSGGGLGGGLGGLGGVLGGGGAGGGLGGGKVAGGGLVGLVVMVVLGIMAAGGGGGSSSSGSLSDVLGRVVPSSTVAPVAERAPGGGVASCRTGADADQREDCRLVAVVNSVQAYWDRTFAASGVKYRPAQTVLFSGRTTSRCGAATADTGPFYCPADGTVYMDLDFFKVLSRPPFNASGGPFAQAYVTAHEYGHHVSTLLGRSTNGERQGANSGSVRLELQADCYAGVWAKNAARDGLVKSISDADIAEGLSAAAAVGDDRIQQATTGRTRPETYTHGTAEQRQRWFTEGYRSGDPGRCDTFSGPI